MKKNKYFIFFISSIVFILIISISITIFSKSNSNIIEEKLNQEINYLDSEILKMINVLNNIDFSNSVLLKQTTVENKDEDKNSENTQNSLKYNIENRNILLQDTDMIDWDYMKDSVETMYSSWPTIMIDLHNCNVKNENVLEFSNYLDLLVINIQNEDKKSTLNNLTKMYGLLPIFLKQFSNDNDKINISYTKSYIIYSYEAAEYENWEELENQIKKANEYFLTITNSIKNKKQQSNINKAYVSINEMNNIISLKNKKLFYLKYINLMETLMML